MDSSRFFLLTLLATTMVIEKSIEAGGDCMCKYKKLFFQKRHYELNNNVVSLTFY